MRDNAGTLSPYPWDLSLLFPLGTKTTDIICSLSQSRNPLAIFPQIERNDTGWYRPSQTRHGAHVASQRCTILHWR